MSNGAVGVGDTLDQLRPFLSDMAASIIAQAASRVPIPRFLPGTVVSVNLPAGTVSVIPDGGGVAITAQNLVGLMAANSRVMLLFVPPSGVLAIAPILFGANAEWGAAWGKMGQVARRTTDQTGITTVVDQGVSVSFTGIAGRLYQATAYANAGSSVDGDLLIGSMTDGNNAVIKRYYQEFMRGTVGSVAGEGSAYFSVVGPYTLKLRFERNGGTGLVSVYGDTNLTYGPQLLVEDVGPA